MLVANRTRPALEALDARDLPAFLGVGLGVCLPPVNVQVSAQVGSTCPPVNSCPTPVYGGLNLGASVGVGLSSKGGDCYSPLLGLSTGLVIGSSFCGPRNLPGFGVCNTTPDTICTPKGGDCTPPAYTCPPVNTCPPVTTCPPVQHGCDNVVKEVVSTVSHIVGGLLSGLSRGYGYGRC